MEKNKNMTMKIINIILSVLFGVCIIINVLNLFINIPLITCLNYASIIGVCILMFIGIIPVLKLNEIKKSTFFAIYFVYLFLPAILLLQNFNYKNKYELVIYLSIAFIISLINCFVVYKNKKEFN